MAANPKLKAGTAMIALKTLTAAVSLVDSSGKDGLEGIEITWAGGQEPEIVKQAREREQSTKSSNGAGPASGSSKRSASNTPEPAQFAYKLPKLDENDVLAKMRARERERERLEEEIRMQDAEADQ